MTVRTPRPAKFEEVSRELQHELELKPHEAAQIAAEYKTLCEAISVTEKERDALKAQLKRFIERTGEPLDVEGVGTLKLQPRSAPATWDALAMWEQNPVEFTRLLNMGAITVNTKVAEALMEAGQVTSIRQYRHDGQGSPALVWVKRD